MSEEWGSLSPERIGKATASRISDVMATTKSGGFGASRERYRGELVQERMTKVSASKDIGYLPAVKWGVEQEPAARAAYEFERQVTVDFAGFVVHPTLAGAGCSPDGLVSQEGLVEIKCPESHTHLAMLESQKPCGAIKIPEKYVLQMQFQMACTQRAWCDFVSFDPRWDPEERLLIYRVQRDDALIAKIEEAVSLFLTEVDAGVERLYKRRHNGGSA